jgi:hypothetical protein
MQAKPLFKQARSSIKQAKSLNMYAKSLCKQGKWSKIASSTGGNVKNPANH